MEDRDVAVFTGVSAAEIGEAAAREGVVLHELTPQTASLEEAYLELTQDDVEYRTSQQAPLAAGMDRAR
jgi:hypothetical protein